MSVKLSKDIAKELYSSANWRKSFVYNQKMPNNIDVHKLGLLLPNGNIKFNTSVGAFEYAKNKCVSALKEKEPFELGIVVADNMVLDEIRGDISSCSIIPSKYKKNIIFYHGHPDMYKEGSTTPISVADFKTLVGFFKCNANIDEIVAFNTKGEYSKLSKIKPTEKTKRNQKINDKIKNQVKYLRIYIKEKSLIKKLGLYPIMKQIDILNYQIFKCLSKGFKDDAEKLYIKLNEIKQEFKLYKASEKDCNLIHNFWVINAKKLGVEYKTNYSDFIKTKG